MSQAPKPEELLRVSHIPPKKDWMDPRVDLVPGTWGYPGKASSLETLGLPNPREWNPTDEDWKLPPNWKEIIHEGLKERLEKYRSLKVFLDICVRCGACADKCHFFIGSGDPKNMPVLRAELLRSIYRKDFTAVGRMLGTFAGGRELTEDVIKEWFYYFHQCTECRRCSLYCPYGIDTAEITIVVRELLNLIGVNIDWILGAAANCYRTGNHLGLEPHTFKGNIDFLVDDIEEYVGVRLNPTFNRKGAEVLFIAPSGDVFADPGIFTYMGYLMLFEHIGLDYTISTYASEGGNFGLFTSQETMKRLNSKMYAEAKRLGVKWILGGECGHMWRVLHQYMDTMNGPADFLEVPKSPITGTVFDNAKSTKMIHIVEFMADLIRHGKLKLNPKRNDYRRTTWHDSCNVSRGMGMFEEPRYVLKSVCNNFFEMPENTIREQTFCCGGGTGLNAGEFEYLRMMGGMPRAFAVKHVQEKHGVNLLVNVCALDRAILPPLMDYWAPEVSVSGLTELVANALVMEGEHDRPTDLRGEDIPGLEGDE
ncbi:sulfate reduction electron transfer complex DsrMKJOP subunit DsrK [Desulfonatronum lacustre]|uniref:sulfate reduction electron transfer complex DsrMKJOP subunit DsrK n=1 Tax=Desulfonatronum lacustre TaxID=66849 RepID=UPI000490181A|nr:(Fe-S)-binding protein [Desulfonatronum lacustre]SMP52699.1 putative sulfite reductase-associated electron transfer protein DsrK [Desulfonatronum zhilinae]